MKTIIEQGVVKKDRPIKVVQFGEGNFLRAFTDYMIDIANEKGIFDGNIAIIKPISFGNLERFEKQDNLYTVVLRGKENGKTVNDKRIITSVAKTLDTSNDYDEYMSLSELESLRFVISNTTEAGIVLDENDSFDTLPSTYPGKLTKFLYNRFKKFDGDESKGLIILPVELIENNGAKLRQCVFALSDIWALGEDFKAWVENANIFCNTLVDRIVTGYPGAEAAEKIYDEIGYTDELIDIGEPFALWVIESDKDISAEFPLDKAGLPIVFTDNQKPYRERKVRVLNGAHTSSVLAAYLCGFDIVRDCMYDRIMGKFIRSIVRNEIAPQVNLPIDEVLAFADSVFERFENPFIDHALLSISLNSVSKWRARVLPSFKDYVKNEGELPKLITFSLAALLAFYTANEIENGALSAKRQNGDCYLVRDDEAVINFFAESSSKPSSVFVPLALANSDFWGEDLNKFDGLTAEVTRWYDMIRKDANAALTAVLEA